MPHLDGRLRRRAAPWLAPAVIALFALPSAPLLAACQIEYSDWLINAISRASGQYVAKYHGNYSSPGACEAARREAIAKSGDPSLATNIQCTGCSAAPQGKGAATSPGVDSAAVADKKRYEAEKKAEEKAAQQQFMRDKQRLSEELKVVTPARGNTLILKQTPPPAASRQQLDCLLRGAKKAEGNDALPPGGDWQNRGDCTPYDPAVPPVPEPVPVTGGATAEAAARDALAALARQIAASRQQLTREEEAITRLEQEVAQEVAREASQQPVTGLKEAPRQSDALRRAREALARARAARQQTAEQLRYLEEQERSSPGANQIKANE
jgi:hypothetical protein